MGALLILDGYFVMGTEQDETDRGEAEAEGDGRDEGRLHCRDVDDVSAAGGSGVSGSDSAVAGVVAGGADPVAAPV